MTATSTTFRWTEKYSVNIAALDNHHKRFFTNINELNDALASGTGGSVTGRILQKLIDHALHHFAAEETLMAEYGFPGTAAHRTEHDRFTQAVAKFLADHRAGKPGVPVSLMLFLQNWLKEHILITDKAYSAFLNDRGVR
ncbi:MAG: bacteriohemerythrin [Terriglobales bacterium]|jgi:hemerythrin